MESCPYHGDECKMYKTSPSGFGLTPRIVDEFGYADQPFGQGKKYKVNSIEDLQMIAAKSQCPFTRIWALVILSRRAMKGYECGIFMPTFSTILNDHYWLFHDRATVRLKLSIIDTIADWGKPIEKSNATLITIFFRMEVLSQTVSKPRDRIKEGYLEFGQTAIMPGNPDVILYMIDRISTALKQTPYLAKLFHSIFIETVQNSNIKNYVELGSIRNGRSGEWEKRNSQALIGKLKEILKPDYLHQLPQRTEPT